MNREMKRTMQRQSQEETESPSAGGDALQRRAVDTETRREAAAPSVAGRVQRFYGEIRQELRQVAWPTRPEVISSFSVVLLTLILLGLLIFGLNYAFSHGVSFLYKS